MITPIIVVSILLAPLIGAWCVGGNNKARLGGLVGISLAFTFFGAGHFIQTDAMVAMLLDIVPARRPLVLLTGFLELAIAIGLLVPGTRRFAGLAAIIVLISFFPANVYAAFNHTGMGGHIWGPEYLLNRLPLQAVLVFWTWTFVLREDADRTALLPR